VRCPLCLTDGGDPGGFRRCGHRLFAWLGDPFGSLNPPALAEAAGVAPRARPTSTGKIVVALAAVVAVSLLSPGWAAAMFAVCAIVLFRWPGASWWTWAMLLTSGVVLALLWALGAGARFVRV